MLIQFITTFTILVTVANAYYNHGSSIVSPHNNYGNYAHYPSTVIPPSTVNLPYSFNNVKPILPYMQSKMISNNTPLSSTAVNTYSTFNQHSDVHRNNNLNQHDYIHQASTYNSLSSPSATYLPSPVISPPSVTYNGNIVPPSIQNLNHNRITLSANYPSHNVQHTNSQHGRHHIPYSTAYSHGTVYNRCH